MYMSALGVATVFFLAAPADVKGEGGEAKAIETIKRLGGSYKVDESAAEKPVVEVNLKNARLTADDLSDLGGLRRLEELRLGRSP